MRALVRAYFTGMRDLGWFRSLPWITQIGTGEHFRIHFHIVLRAGDTLDIAASNKLGEGVRSAPALAGDAICLRGAEHLWAFSAKKADGRP